MSGTGSLIKNPYEATVFKNDKELQDFIKCCDPQTGYLYFMDNFFMIQHPTQGSMNYHPWDYQKRLIETYHNYRFSISLMPRQSGKSTSAAGYLLWYAMFVPDSTILIAAHKYAGSQEIMQRIRYGYENCPLHIKAGVVTYNKGSLDFENGSRIISATTTENTGRGLSISLLYLDEFAFVRPSIAKEFWTSIAPTLATGGKAIITSTPNSDEDQFAIIWKAANKTQDEYGNETLLGVNGFKAYKAHWSEQPGRDTAWADEMRSQLGEERFRREIGCFSGKTNIRLKDSTGKIFTTTMEELEKMLAIRNSNHRILFVEELLKNNLGLQILTDTGWQSFSGIVKKGIKHTITIELENISVTLTPDHNVFLENLTKIPANNLRKGDSVCTLNGPQIVKNIYEHCLEVVYDIVNAGSNKRFYADDILCSNCEFIIGDETLINPLILNTLEGIEPIERMGQVRWFSKPQKGNIYSVGLDPSLGTGSDPAAIQIFEANTTKQVGEWKHNRTTIPEQIKLLAKINDYIVDITKEPNNLYYSLENNTIGEAALISLAEYGEENIKGTMLSEPKQVGSTRRYRKGFNTTQKSKLAACSKLKNLIESGKMSLKSNALISELKSFVAAEGSYAAKIGETDDLVMATLLVVRIFQHLQNYHSDLDTHLKDHSEYIEPMPFIMTLSSVS